MINYHKILINLECERSENEKEVGKWTVEFRKRSCNKS
jgi:hypothetical protein